MHGVSTVHADADAAEESMYDVRGRYDIPGIRLLYDVCTAE